MMTLGLSLMLAAPDTPNMMLPVLRLVQRFGDPAGLTPDKDRALKTHLAALHGKTEVSFEDLRPAMDSTTFQRLTNGPRLGLAQMEQRLREAEPKSRSSLLPAVRRHCDLLSTQFEMIDRDHHAGLEAFTAWIVKNSKSNEPLSVIILCTGNTRRSMLGAAMGNAAAAYYGLNIRFHSGGTTPDAFNPRTITALKAIGFAIEPTGSDAPHGPADRANPIYRVQWGEGLETKEFSKVYTDAANPHNGYAALLVCSEADTACPSVKGASVRIPVPYLDPKLYDGTPIEAEKYAERRDDIGRFMLSAMLQAHRRLER